MKLDMTTAKNSFKYGWLLKRIFPYIRPYMFRIICGFLVAIPLGLLDGVTAFALKPFRQIWQRDKTVNKDKAIMELGFIYFFCDPRSDYQYIIDEESRKASNKEGEGLPSDWEPDNLVLEAMEFYKTFKPASALLLEDTRVAVDKLRTLLREIDLGAVDDKGKPIYTLNTITATIKQIPSLVKDLNEAEAAIAKEIAQSNKVRGAQEKAMYEDL